MSFQTRKIRPERPQPPEKPKKPTFQISSAEHGKTKISIGIFSSLIIILLIIFGIFKAIAAIDLGIILKVAGSDVQKDAYGHTNFLLLGNGGGNHDGADLTDTIIVASIDQEQNLITMVSIPRDLYVDNKEIGSGRINQIYYNAKRHYSSSLRAVDQLKQEVEKIMGVPIHYWARIDFQGFTDIIDALGGVEIQVPNDIYDPDYPAEGGRPGFQISAGLQTLDGATALKYARSRKSTSDFDRANRQQLIIQAMKDKALKTEILFSADKIRGILEAVSANIDTNITVKEILTLGSSLKDIDTEKITHRLLHDDPSRCGGFLYPPERRFYGGAFVLIPAGGFEFIHLYSELNFNQPQIGHENLKIHVLNGTKAGGVAGEAKQILQRFCFDINRYGNANTIPIEKTTYYYKGEIRPETLDFLQKLIPGAEVAGIPAEYAEYAIETDLILEIGNDYLNSPNYISDPFYSLQTQYNAPAEPAPAVAEPAPTDQ